MLLEMQSLLSQRPKQFPGVSTFSMLHREGNRTVRVAMGVADTNGLPSWSEWLQAYARAIDYSVRQIRRVIFNEPRKKAVNICGWSKTDHNRLITAATGALDLANAVEAGSDTRALCREIKNQMGDVGEIIERSFEPVRKKLCKRPKRKVTR